MSDTPKVETLLTSALSYRQKGFSVIPVRSNKKPYIRWEQYQQKKATPDEIKAWWKKWPTANIGIVTGAISGIAVIDIDTPEGFEEINKYIPDSLEIPTATTPRGGQHLYFQCSDKTLMNNARTIPGCDLRANGGYIIAPPSRNGSGKPYAWRGRLSLDDLAPPTMPEAYITKVFYSIGYKEDVVNDHTKPQGTTNFTEMFTHGRRDNDLFHVANVLIKGGMPQDETRHVVEMIAKLCTPPFSSGEAALKVQSALERKMRGERNLADEIRQWAKTTEGHFITTEVHSELQITTSRDKKTCYMALKRLCDEGILEKYGDKRGSFRVIDNACEDIDWQNATDERINLLWPFEIERYVQILPKNIIVIAGSPNAGKTAFLLNFIRQNMHNHEVYYFSSEMGAIELKSRLDKFNIPRKSWRFHAKERASHFADVIRPDAVNVIDFLEVHDEFYKIGGLIKEVFDKLKTGVAVIAIQMNKGAAVGLGGMRGLEKARLYLTIDGSKTKMVKAKNSADPQVNPNGLEIDFSLAQGCSFKEKNEWHKAG